MNDSIDRYARRELTAAESRELAQNSLDAPELFDELTDSALAQAGLSARSVAGGRVIRFPRKTRIVSAIAAAVAAAIVLFSFVSPRKRPQVTQSGPAEVAATPSPKPALPSAAQPGQPILLASIRPPAGAEVFRGIEPDRRAPRQTGSIVSIEDGLAEIDLGSLDGLAKGSELEVYRGGLSTAPTERLVVTTVFRERARGRIAGIDVVRVHNLVQVADAIYLGALLEQIDALSNRGDADGALQMAEKAALYAPLHNVRPAEKGRSLNLLAVLRMLHGDYDGAGAPLKQAVSVSYAPALNNLGVLAELRGDRREAAEHYAEAQRALAGAADATAQDRQAVATNLARTKGVR